METLFRPRLRSSDDRVASATPLTRATSSSSRTGGAARASGVRPLLGGGLGLRAVGGQRRGAPHGRADQAPGRAARGLDFDLHGVARPERRRARGRAGQDDVARLQRDQLRQVADDLRQREQQVGGGVLLHQLAVAPDPDRDGGRVEPARRAAAGARSRCTRRRPWSARWQPLSAQRRSNTPEVVRGGDRGDRGPRRPPRRPAAPGCRSPARSRPRSRGSRRPRAARRRRRATARWRASGSSPGPPGCGPSARRGRRSRCAWRRRCRAARPAAPTPRAAVHAPRTEHIRSGPGQKLPRLACSRSSASNSAWKLPLPKPSEPCRSMSSKNTVGRSPIGLVKICSR